MKTVAEALEDSDSKYCPSAFAVPSAMRLALLFKKIANKTMTRRYLVIYKSGCGHLSAFAPDVPGFGCIGHSLEELRENLHDGLEFYLEDLALKGKPIPESSVGFNDISERGFAEIMSVRVWVGEPNAGKMQVRPCPAARRPSCFGYSL